MRKVDFGETSRIVTFLTPLRGRMACMARGARRKGGPLLAALDTYNRLELSYSWKDGRQVQTLVEAVVLDPFNPIKQDLERTAAAAFVLETALYAARENNPAPELYDALLEGLAGIAQASAVPAAWAALAVHGLLDAAGVTPECDDAAVAEYARTLSATERRCICQALRHMQTACAPPLEDDLKPTLEYLQRYAGCHFDAPMKSYPFLKSMLGPN